MQFLVIAVLVGLLPLRRVSRVFLGSYNQPANAPACASLRVRRFFTTLAQMRRSKFKKVSYFRSASRPLIAVLAVAVLAGACGGKADNRATARSSPEVTASDPSVAAATTSTVTKSRYSAEPFTSTTRDGTN